MPYVLGIPFYATVFRADGFAEALEQIAPLSLRYGATEYFVWRSGDDRYKFHAYFHFESKVDWERYWYGPEFIAWRERYSSWYQIPVVYDAGEMVTSGRTEVSERGVEGTGAVVNGG